MNTTSTSLVVLWILSTSVVCAQSIDITGLPTPGAAGLVEGSVSGVNTAIHEVAAYLHVEGAGWWTKPTSAMPTVPINPDGSFSVNIGTGGLDEFASNYVVSVLPTGSSIPSMLGNSTLDLGAASIVTAHEQRFGTNLSFSGRNWGVKEAPTPVGPGGNQFSASSNDVWVDQDGLHLTVQNHGGLWYSTEVVLTENLGYGTYAFQTNSRQDILDANVTFGAFTWDSFGDEFRIPAEPHRELDFEDTRWGDPFSSTNSQVVVQPFDGPSALHSLTLPDLSSDAALTRFFVWSPGRVEFYSLLGHHSPSDFPPEAVIDHYVYTENLAAGRVVPEPGRENFRFNLWLNDSAPNGGQPIEAVINDFQFTALTAGDFDWDTDVDGRDFLKWQRGDSPGSLSGSDLSDWQNNFGTPAASAASAAITVPEPTSAILLLFAAALAARAHLFPFYRRGGFQPPWTDERRLEATTTS